MEGWCLGGAQIAGHVKTETVERPKHTPLAAFVNLSKSTAVIGLSDKRAETCASLSTSRDIKAFQ